MSKRKAKANADAASALKRKLRILIANDDGISSQGIQALARAMKKLGHVTVVAPEREQSTMGHALTLHKPVRLFHILSEPGMDQWALSGTPADCVYMALRYLLKQKPDIIISGINRGVNLGNDVYYSGTVAAAREGAVLGIPAIATSLDYHYDPGSKDPVYFEEAAEYMVHLVRQVISNGMQPGCMLNVNFPNVPFSKIKGVRVSRMGFRVYSGELEKKVDPRGKGYFWLAGRYEGFHPIPGSDCEVLDQNYISITPVRIDVTHYENMEKLGQWPLEPKGLIKKIAGMMQKSRRGKKSTPAPAE